jgi:hypothetical protein
MAALLAAPAAGAAPGTPAAGMYTTPLIPGDVSPVAGEPVLDQNWTGYVATGSWSGASFPQVYADFSVPSVNCATTPNGSVSHWIGLDGAGYNLTASNSLEAEGVTAQCVNGTASYYAWWETYPQAQTDAATVQPGDAINADIMYTAGAPDPYALNLSDVTSGQGFSVKKACAAATCLNSSAEVITAAPSDQASTQAGDVEPLADYGQENFVRIGLEDHSQQFGGFTASYWVTHEVAGPNMGGLVINGQSGVLYGGAAFFNAWPPLVEPASR